MKTKRIRQDVEGGWGEVDRGEKKYEEYTFVDLMVRSCNAFL